MWLQGLKRGLRGLPKREIEDIVQHYSESYDERVEQGVDKDEALRQLGNCCEIAKIHKYARREWTESGNSSTPKLLYKWRVAAIALMAICIPIYLAV
jgi:uncharacterized membrane protein